MAKRSDYIAVFDSGVGGISVLRQLRKVLPKERYLYFGDSANAPYGVRPVGEIQKLTLAAAKKLVAQGVKAFVIACNTATSAAYEALVEKYPDLIVVGIEPALALAAQQFPGGTIGALATPATLKGERFLKKKAQYDSICQVIPLPAPGLMDLVEAGKYDSAEADALLHTFLDPYVGKLDALLLGCTHYPIVEKAIKRVMGEDIVLLDGAVVTAAQTRTALEQAGLLYDGPSELVIQNSLTDERMLKLSWQLAGLK